MQADAEAAIDLVNFAYFKKVVQKPKKVRQKNVDEDGGEDKGQKRLGETILQCTCARSLETR